MNTTVLWIVVSGAAAAVGVLLVWKQQRNATRAKQLQSRRQSAIESSPLTAELDACFTELSREEFALLDFSEASSDFARYYSMWEHRPQEFIRVFKALKDTGLEREMIRALTGDYIDRNSEEFFGELFEGWQNLLRKKGHLGKKSKAPKVAKKRAPKKVRKSLPYDHAACEELVEATETDAELLVLLRSMEHSDLAERIVMKLCSQSALAEVIEEHTWEEFTVTAAKRLHDRSLVHDLIVRKRDQKLRKILAKRLTNEADLVKLFKENRSPDIREAVLGAIKDDETLENLMTPDVLSQGYLEGYWERVAKYHRPLRRVLKRVMEPEPGRNVNIPSALEKEVYSLSDLAEINGRLMRFELPVAERELLIKRFHELVKEDPLRFEAFADDCLERQYHYGPSVFEIRPDPGLNDKGSFGSWLAALADEIDVDGNLKRGLKRLSGSSAKTFSHAIEFLFVSRLISTVYERQNDDFKRGFGKSLDEYYEWNYKETVDELMKHEKGAEALLRSPKRVDFIIERLSQHLTWIDF